MDDLLQNSLIKYGLNSIFRGSSYNRRGCKSSIEKDSVIFNESFSTQWFGLLEDDEKQYALEYVSQHFPTIYEDGGDGWVSLIDGVSNYEISDKDIYGWYGKSLTVQAALLNPNYDWSPLFNKYVSENTSLSYISASIRTIVNSYAESNREDFYNYALKNAKTHKWEVRALLYEALIKSGTLTSKMARRMRSDGAAKASRCAVRSLISNKELYSDSHSLFVQFVDTTYEEVACELARGIPESMITYMVGSQFYHVKRIVEDRMRQIEKRKEDEERGFSIPEEEVPF